MVNIKDTKSSLIKIKFKIRLDVNIVYLFFVIIPTKNKNILLSAEKKKTNNTLYSIGTYKKLPKKTIFNQNRRFKFKNNTGSIKNKYLLTKNRIK